MLLRKILVAGVLLCSAAIAHTQDSTRFSFHFQFTSVSQHHSVFQAPYSGDNSLEPEEGTASSLTATLFLAAKPWTNGLFILNPEVAGGEGLSGATGIAGFTNGEIFRVGNPKPTIYLARLVLEQKFPLKNTKYEEATEDMNRVAGKTPVDYVRLFAGRFCLADYFDGNPYSHDPRSQFLNWSFMSAGAYDYAADTRGYTWGIGAEWKKNNWRAAAAVTLEPAVANSLEMDMHINKAFASQLELTHFHRIGNKPGQLQLTLFLNKAQMGNYEQAVKNRITPPDITTAANYKNHKWGWIINAAQDLGNNWGAYTRLSSNDGHNETWAFTEIDRSLNIGVQKTGAGKFQNVLGLGTVLNGLSTPHQDYLKAGGYGFIIGDGRLNYAPEWITELYYRVNLFNNRLQVSPDYQFVINPAYNKDRGPVHFFSLRTHIAF